MYYLLSKMDDSSLIYAYNSKITILKMKDEKYSTTLLKATMRKAVGDKTVKLFFN